MVMATVAEKYQGKSIRKHAHHASMIVMLMLLTVGKDSEPAVWEITPSLDLIETYSNNVKLTTAGNEKDDFISQVNPGILLTATGSRLNMNAHYLMKNYAYANEGSRNSTQNMLKAGANAELLDSYIYLDAQSSVSQQNISPLAPVALDNYNISDNRTEFRAYSISPYFKHQFGNIISTELRYAHNAVSNNTNGLMNSQDDKVSLLINNGSFFNNFAWEGSYGRQTITYLNSANNTENENARIKLAYKIVSSFSLTATGGYDNYNYQTFNQSQKSGGPFWLAGFSWLPSDRTKLEASFGKRYWGDTSSLTANHRTRRTFLAVGYNESISNSNSQFLIPATIDTSSFLNQLWSSSIPDPVIRQKIVDAFIIENGLADSLANPVNFLTNRIFLQKQLQASLAISGSKNTLLFSLFSVRREAQTAQITDSALFGVNNMALNDTSEQNGTNIMWNLKFSPRTSASSSAGYMQNSFPELHTKYNIKTISLSLNRNFHPAMNGSIMLRKIEQESDQATGSYHEDSLTASIQMFF